MYINILYSPCHLPKHRLKIYRDEEDVKTKERMLLVLNVVYQGKTSAHVATDLHRNRAWACVWLKRYGKKV